MSNFFYSGSELRVQEARQCAQKIKSPVLAEIAKAHAESLDMILSLLALPLGLLGTAVAETHRIAFFAQAIVSTKNLDNWDKSEVSKKQVSEEVERLFKEYDSNSSSGSAVIDEAKLRLEHLAEMPIIENSLQVLLYAGLTLCWATFESTCKDLWEAALNARPKKLAQRAFKHLPDSMEQNELTKKSVSIGLLARYDFDVQEKLGTILAGKFDFTGYNGIRAAYLSVFGDSPALHEIFSDSSPQLLEATRHLIVHRGGHVDEEYKRRTGEQAPMGTRLHMTGKRVTELTGGTAELACRLLVYVDEFLLHTDSTS